MVGLAQNCQVIESIDGQRLSSSTLRDINEGGLPRLRAATFGMGPEDLLETLGVERPENDMQVTFSPL